MSKQTFGATKELCVYVCVSRGWGKGGKFQNRLSQ